MEEDAKVEYACGSYEPGSPEKSCSFVKSLRFDLDAKEAEKPAEVPRLPPATVDAGRAGE